MEIEENEKIIERKNIKKIDIAAGIIAAIDELGNVHKPKIALGIARMICANYGIEILLSRQGTDERVL